MDEKTTSLQKLSAALPALTRINELYHTAVNLNAQNEAILAADNVTYRHRGMILSIGAGFLAAMISSMLLGGILNLFHGKLDTFGVFLFLGIGVAVYFYVNKRTTATMPQTNQRIEENKRTIQEISEEIERIATQNSDAINALPRDYRFYDAAVFMERAFSNGRCSTMKEAIDLYEEYAHRRALEEYNQQLVEENRRQNAMLASIEANSADAARDSGFTAVFSVLNFMK